MAKVDDVAAYIVQKLGRIPTMKLQKLAYFAHGWNLVWNDKFLFHEEIQAWKYGPVVPHLWNQHQRKPAVDSWDSGNAKDLTDEERHVIDVIVDHYKSVSGFNLGDESHRHEVWKNHFDSSIPAVEAREPMPAKEIKASFVELYTKA